MQTGPGVRGGMPAGEVRRGGADPGERYRARMAPQSTRQPPPHAAPILRPTFPNSQADGHQQSAEVRRVRNDCEGRVASPVNRPLSTARWGDPPPHPPPPPPPHLRRPMRRRAAPPAAARTPVPPRCDPFSLPPLVRRRTAAVSRPPPSSAQPVPRRRRRGAGDAVRGEGGRAAAGARRRRRPRRRRQGTGCHHGALLSPWRGGGVGARRLGGEWGERAETGRPAVWGGCG
jgi:hypothetical protein